MQFIKQTDEGCVTEIALSEVWVLFFGLVFCLVFGFLFWGGLVLGAFCVCVTILIMKLLC